MKTAELSGALLDYWVARAEGIEGVELKDGHAFKRIRQEEYRLFLYSTSWTHGGPIIERERINVCEPDHSFGAHGAETRDWCAFFSRVNGCMQHGPTPLIAAMRAYVASKFGDEVPDER